MSSEGERAGWVYLDHAATTPVAPEVVSVMLPHLRESYGNPSSIHGLGRAARQAVDQARDQLAAVLHCTPGEVVFTGSGTEADNLALRGVVDQASSPGHVVVSAIEHDAVRETATRLAELGRVATDVVGCDSMGRIDPGEVAALVRDDTLLVSVMLANNEVGTTQDVAAIGAAVKARNPRTLMHTDAVQALGKLRLDVDALGVDLLAVSAHKVYGPKGVGALYVRRGITLAPQLSGGHQERNRRSGTENVAGIAGFGVAAAAAEAERETEVPRLARLTRELGERVTSGLGGAICTGHPDQRLASIASFAFDGVRTELLLAVLDQHGICASGGSACSSGASVPSHVLTALDVPSGSISGALRCSLGRSTTDAAIRRAAATIIAAVEQVRRSGRKVWEAGSA